MKKLIGWVVFMAPAVAGLALVACGNPHARTTYYNVVCMTAGEGLTFKAEQMKQINMHKRSTVTLYRFERDDYSLYQMRPGEVCTVSEHEGEVK